MTLYVRNIYTKKWSSENRRMVITIQVVRTAQAAHRNNRAMMKLVRNTVILRKAIHCGKLMANFRRGCLLSSLGGSEYIVPTLLAFIVLLLP